MPREIKLTKGKVATVDDADFEMLNKHKWHLCRKTHKEYAYRRDYTNGKPGKMVSMHRVILEAKPGSTIDHINGDGLDNRRNNLKFVNKSQNGFNSGPKSYNTSGFKGVEKFGNNWKASVKINGYRFRSDSFYTKEEAALAYNELAKLVYEHAYLNKVKE